MALNLLNEKLCWRVEFDINVSDLGCVRYFSSMAMEQHASKGGGFLFFSASNSSSSSSSSVHIFGKPNSIIIHFIAPQMFGYCIESTPDDNSTALSSSSASDKENVTIIGFVKKCKEEFCLRTFAA